MVKVCIAAKRKKEMREMKQYYITTETRFDPYTEKEKEYAIVELDKEVAKIIVKTKRQLAAQKEYALEEERKAWNQVIIKKKKRHYVQAMPLFEETIIGNYSARMLHCLMLLLPYATYNSTKQNKEDALEKDGEYLTNTSIYTLWGVSNKTGARYIDQFLADGILEQVKLFGINGKTYRFHPNMFLRGKKEQQDIFTKKVVLDNLLHIIEAIQKETNNVLKKEKNKKKTSFTTMYPLALFAVFLTKTHYATYFLLHNNTDPTLIREGEEVSTVLTKERRKRAFRFLKQYEMWNLATGQKNTTLNTREKKELEACIQVLIHAGVIGRWENKKGKFLLMNPNVVFISHETQIDHNWKNTLEGLFGLGESKGRGNE